MSSDCLKDTCNDSTSSSFEIDPTYGYMWPQRNYKCSFCKKEFGSAQALGGHMNVHRRERAKLRLSPSSCPDLNPNPNPNFSSPSSSSSPIPAAKYAPNMNNQSFVEPAMISLSPSSASSFAEGSQYDVHGISQHNHVRKMPRTESFFGFEDATSFVEESEVRVFKTREIVKMDTDMDFLGDAKEDLDLELRLGYA